MLTIRELLDVARGRMTVSRAMMHSKDAILQHLLASEDPAIVAALHELVSERIPEVASGSSREEDSLRVLGDDGFAELSRADLLEVARAHGPVSRNARRDKRSLLQHLLSSGVESVLGELRERKRARDSESEGGRRVRPRASEDQQADSGQSGPSMEPSSAAEGVAVAGNSPSTLELESRREEGERYEGRGARNVDSYLSVPSQQVFDSCYWEFFEATSGRRVRSLVCAVCARRLQQEADGVEDVALATIIHRSRLHPSVPHPAHDLFDGCLLEPAGVSISTEGSVVVKLCRMCRKDLSRAGRQGPPRLSLANNLWIGRIAAELLELTVPEQVLIALLFPRVFVFKLYPKGGHHPDPDRLQRAMRGTVTTYEMNIQDIVSMISGDLLPHKPAVLASVITVTFVGVGSLPKKWLKRTFRVRRPVLARALEILSVQNRHYRDVQISAERLAELPEDDVPQELMQTIRQCSDLGIAAQERDGYVPDDDEDGHDQDSLHGRGGECGCESRFLLLSEPGC